MIEKGEQYTNETDVYLARAKQLGLRPATDFLLETGLDLDDLEDCNMDWGIHKSGGTT